MAVIAQADPYKNLIRKIGYSVGLEKLVERVKKVVSLYVRDQSLSPGAFRDLVEKDFGRRNAVEHFANFYGTLNLVRVIGRDQQLGKVGKSNSKRPQVPKALEPLYQLDSLSILRRLFESDDDKYGAALKVVLTQCIIEADGDIFLNALVSDFQTSELKILLETMLRTKREKAGRVLRTPGLLSKLYQILDIKNESSPTSENRLDAVPQGRFGRRTESLDSSRRTSPLTPTTESVIDVPSDYLDKVTNSRKGWAEDLGLFQEREKTERGKGLLRSLERCVVWTDTKPTSALFWGYRSDLKRLHLKVNDLAACDCEAWDLLRAIANSYRISTSPPSEGAPKPDELVDLLRRIFDLYKAGNSKGLIRNSLPLYVAEPVLAGWCVAEGRALPELRHILQEEYKKDVRRVQEMIIRGTAGALFFMSQ